MTPETKLMLGTAGHVDHGKTALVKLLTGCETDTLKEERQRGLTIDLGFAPCQLANNRVVGIVDVPGHADFIRNMVAGAHGINLVMLVVAADDGIMPQTLEHLQILTLMGVKHGIVALTKVDLVDSARQAEVTARLRQLLANTFLGSAPICPISNITGQGFEFFFESLNSAAAACPGRSSRGLFRMWVEDVFTIRGAGTIVTGIPSSGRVSTGDFVHLTQGGSQARIRKIQVYGKDATIACAGECAALNVPDLDHTRIRRGMLLGDATATSVSTTAETELHLLGRFRADGRDLMTVKDGAEVHFHIGTAAVMAKVAMLEKGEMLPGESQLVQFRLSEPLPLAPGERFVIRGTPGEPSLGLVTLGGGRILGACNGRLRRRKPAVISALAARSKALDDPAEWTLLLLREANGPVRIEELLAPLRPEELQEVVASLLEHGKALRTESGRLLHPSVVEVAAQRVITEVESTVRANPQRPGMQSAELQVALALDPEVLRLACEFLLKTGRLERTGVVLSPSGWRAKVSSEEESLSERIGEAFRLAAWSSPSAEELGAEIRAQPAAVARAIRVLQDRGVLVRLDDKISMHTESIQRAKEIAVMLFRKKPVFTTMEFRDALGVSRKFAVPLLDYLDRARYTVRSGHDRTPGAEARKLLSAPASRVQAAQSPRP